MIEDIKAAYFFYLESPVKCITKQPVLITNITNSVSANNNRLQLITKKARLTKN